MRPKKMRHLIAIALPIAAFVLLMLGCRPSARRTTIDTELLDTSTTILTYGGTLFPIPSAWEVFELLQQQQLDYAPQLLNSTNNATRYTTSAKQALNLGIWAAEMSYLNAYSKSQEVMDVMIAVRNMCIELGVDKAIRESSLANPDSIAQQPQTLARVISQAFGLINHELGQAERADVGGLIIAGAWIESIYLLSQLALTHNNREVINRIGELQQPLNNLIDLLSPYYYKSESFTQLIDALIELQQSFKGVIYTYTYAPSTVEPEQKHIIINSKSRIVISEHLLRQIGQQVASIRAQIIE